MIKNLLLHWKIWKMKKTTKKMKNIFLYLKIMMEMNDGDGDGDDDDEFNFKLKKIDFYQFYINYLYSKIFCKNNTTQNIINVCNEIINKYFSMEEIIYNQILLENLLKDYRWNNIGLSDLRNHHLFEKLKVLESLES